VTGDFKTTGVCTEQVSIQIDRMLYRIGWCIE
jgi:hypothetical protein